MARNHSPGLVFLFFNGYKNPLQNSQAGTITACLGRRLTRCSSHHAWTIPNTSSANSNTGIASSGCIAHFSGRTFIVSTNWMAVGSHVYSVVTRNCLGVTPCAPNARRMLAAASTAATAMSCVYSTNATMPFRMRSLDVPAWLLPRGSFWYQRVRRMQRRFDSRQEVLSSHLNGCDRNTWYRLASSTWAMPCSAPRWHETPMRQGLKRSWTRAEALASCRNRTTCRRGCGRLHDS